MERLSLFFLLPILFVSASGLAAGSGLISKISPEVQSKIESEWKKIDKGRPTLVWTYRITPAFPASWPYKGTDYRYVYAFGQDMQNMLSDGERIAAPWARIEDSAEGRKIVMLSGKLTDIGIQGVRPLKSEEINLNKAHEEALSKGQATYESQRQYYCLWISTNGVIADAIRRNHDAFFKWLGCR